MRPFRPETKCPLDGIRVLDLSRLVAGNMLSLQLADFGAEVVKIEDPGKGDPLRDWRVDGISVHWKVYARNKKSLTLNLRDREGRDLLLRLVGGAQVFIESFRPGTLESDGPRTGDAAAAQPPARHRAGVGLGSGWALSGSSGLREPGRGHVGFRRQDRLSRPAAGAAAAGAGGHGRRPLWRRAVLVALRAIEVNGGKGQVIDLPLLDPIVSILGPEPAVFKLTGEIKPRLGSRSATASPRNVFQTSDGRWIAISASIQGMAERAVSRHRPRRHDR